jgi:hypothetical protein
MKTTTYLSTIPRRQQSTEAKAIAGCRFAKIITAAVIGLSLAGAVPVRAEPPLPGAIFTTDSTCSGVNVNIFGDPSKTTDIQIEAGKDLVHLDGGPPRPGAAGLPAGSYYVQVTSPDGQLLGTSVGSGNETPFVVDEFNEPEDCYQLTKILIKASDGTPGFDTTPNPGGEYKVWVSTVATFDNNSTKTDNFKVFGDDGEEIVDPDPATLVVDKFYDANANGQADPGELYIDDWQVSIIGAALDTIELTKVSMLVQPGTFLVDEKHPVEPNWFHTASLLDGAPPSQVNPVSVTLAPNSTHTVLFGNLCLGAGGGLTLGFWSNKNGQALIGNDDLCMLRKLNLRTATGGDSDPASSGDFRTWILGATATNMAYMLSAQLAAMELNVFNGKVNGGALIYAPGTESANSLGFATVNAVMAEADTELGLHGLTLAGSPDRAYQEALKNALDNANNNKTFVQATPCPFTFAPAP